MKNVCLFILTIFFISKTFSQNAIINNNYITVNAGDTTIVNMNSNNYDPDEGEYFIIKSYTVINSTLNTIKYSSKTDSTLKILVNPYTSNKNATIICSVNEMRNGFILATYKDTLFISINKSKRFEMLDINNINSLYNSDGMFFSANNPIGNFTAPINTSIYCRYASRINFAGIDNQNNLKVCVGDINESNTDYQTGIITNNQLLSYKQKFNRVWCLTKNQIDEHIQNFNIPNYAIDSTLLLWPCNGDTTMGELFQMAAFKDLNYNSIYEPLLGEYPIIKGDKCIYFIFNDKYKINTHGGLNLGLEIHTMAYAYKNINNKATYNTQFVEFTIYNRSDLNYSNFIISFYEDIDLGNYFDDYNGCDTILNLAYSYNSTPTDLSSLNSYGNYPPSTGLLLLNNKIESFYVSDDNLNLPTLNVEFNNIFNGKFRNGNNIYYGGNGIFGNPGVSNTIVKKMYFGDINDSLQWSEKSVKNKTGDRKYYVSITPRNFAPNEKIKFDIAFIFAQDSNLNHLQNISLLKQYALSIKDFYQVIGKEEITKYENKIKIYPNPANDKFYVDFGKDNENFNVYIYDINGKLILSKKVVQNYSSIDVNSLKQGIYFVNFSNNKKTFTTKLVKN